MSFFSDIEIAMAQLPKDIDLMASEIGLMPYEIDLYGKKKAKVSLKILDRLKDAPSGKYILCAGYVTWLRSFRFVDIFVWCIFHQISLLAIRWLYMFSTVVSVYFLMNISDEK